MKVCIAGGGRVGRYLAQSLLANRHSVVIIEPVESREVKKIQEFVIVVDTSYSTSGELIHNFLKETYTILTEQNSFFAKSRIRILSLIHI